MKEANFLRSVKEVKFGAWSLNPKLQIIFDGEVERELEPLLFKILCYLIINKDEIITRQNLIDDVWCQHYVDDNAINRAMSELRRALKSELQRGLVVKTHYRKGYSFFLEPEILYHSENSVEATSNQVRRISIAIKEKKARFILFTIAIAIVFYIYSYLQGDAKTEEVNVISKEHKEETLSWMEGGYSKMVVSPDNLFTAVSFTKSGQEHTSILIKNLVTGQERKINGVDRSLYPIGWNISGLELIYKSVKNDVCSLWKVDVSLVKKSDYLYDCQVQYVQGVGVGDNIYIYTKYGYRQKGELSVIVSKNISTGNEYQISSPSLNSYGDKFLYYIKSEKKILFERQKLNSSELFITDIEGGDQVKLFETRNRIWTLNYNKLNQSILWYDNIDNILYEFSLLNKKMISKTSLSEAEMYSFSYPISKSELLAVTYPYTYNTSSFDIDSEKITYELVENYSSSFIGENIVSLKVNNEGKNAINIEEKDNKNRVVNSRTLPLNYNGVVGNPFGSYEILGINKSFIDILDYKNLSIKSRIGVDGDVVSATYLSRDDIGYVVYKKSEATNFSYIFDKESLRSKLAPINDAVWFSQLSPSKYIYLSTSNDLLLFDTVDGISVLDKNIKQGYYYQSLSFSMPYLYHSDGKILTQYDLSDTSDVKKRSIYTAESKNLISNISSSKENKILLIDLITFNENELVRITLE